MSKAKQLRLGAFMRPVSIHTAAWRYPGGTPDANFNLKALVQYAQTLERLAVASPFQNGFDWIPIPSAVTRRIFPGERRRSAP